MRGCLSGQVVVCASGMTGHQAGVEMEWSGTRRVLRWIDSGTRRVASLNAEVGGGGVWARVATLATLETGPFLAQGAEGEIEFNVEKGVKITRAGDCSYRGTCTSLTVLGARGEQLGGGAGAEG